MGKKDKHKLGQSRNDPVFKVANGKLNKQKGKAKEVTTKLKKIGIHKKADAAVAKLDDQLKALQKQSISLTGKPRNTKVTPSATLKDEADPRVNIDELVDEMEDLSKTNKT